MFSQLSFLSWFGPCSIGFILVQETSLTFLRTVNPNIILAGKLNEHWSLPLSLHIRVASGCENWDLKLWKLMLCALKWNWHLSEKCCTEVSPSRQFVCSYCKSAKLSRYSAGDDSHHLQPGFSEILWRESRWAYRKQSPTTHNPSLLHSITPTSLGIWLRNPLCPIYASLNAIMDHHPLSISPRFLHVQKHVESWDPSLVWRKDFCEKGDNLLAYQSHLVVYSSYPAWVDRGFNFLSI